MKDDVSSLATMRPGQMAVITGVLRLDANVQRLMSLGLVEGAEIEMAGRAIGGDPLEFRLFGCGISLRREQADAFLVAPAGSGD
ncbi:MAG: FeoA family protein [Woeseiaceae bacterium]|jgi:ferrous iron transport protein A|nr:FeoA family protein [Woeseiaceae bacterium]